jgi:rhamnosyltransferase
MTGRSVCAVIVTYHPSRTMLEGIPQVLAQVPALVVVDNGSNSDELRALRVAHQTLGFELIENGGNLGVAEALNQGARWAKGKGYDWVIFFDQDSTITTNFIDEMFSAWKSHAERDRVASVHPRYLDPKTGSESPVRRARDGGPVTSMTSGALMPTWIFDKIGWFASEYFIDWVDFEYCFRIRAAGYLITDARRAVLLHAAGNSDRQLSFVGLTFRPTHHSAIRRYYISRNRIAVFRKYFFIFPQWILQSMYDSLRETIKCFIGEKDRSSKLRGLWLGIWDGLTKRMGKREAI